MSQAPMMPVFVDALLGDTLDLSVEEFGAYLLLLFATWRNNGRPLPDDAPKLARICRCSVPRWNRVLRPALIGFFRRDDDGFLHQKRLEKEWAFCAEFKAKQAANGARGGRPKKADKPLKSNGMAEPNGLVWDNPQTAPGTREKHPVTKLNPQAEFAAENSPNQLESFNAAKATGKPKPNPNESPLTLVEERKNLAPKELNSFLPSTARESSPPLPSQGDGVAATRAPIPEPVTVFDDPELRAYGNAAFDRCLEALRGKRSVLEGR